MPIIIPINTFFLNRIKARDLGVIIDKNLSMKKHINAVCKSVYAGIRNIGKLRKYLDASTTERLHSKKYLVKIFSALNWESVSTQILVKKNFIFFLIGCHSIT